MNKKRKRIAIILAGGRGKRMGKDYPKCLTKIKDKTMIEMVIDNLNNAKIDEIISVLGYKADKVYDVIKNKCNVCYQKKQLGTADALKSARDLFENKKADILIMASDMPFISSFSIDEAFNEYYKENCDLLVTSCKVSYESNLGRVVRKNGEIIKIIEKKDLDKSSETDEVNASMYIAKSEEIFNYLKMIKNDNNQKEYYLTDIVELYYKDNKKIGSYNLASANEIVGVNDEIDLKKAIEIYENIKK